MTTLDIARIICPDCCCGAKYEKEKDRKQLSVSNSSTVRTSDSENRDKVHETT